MKTNWYYIHGAPNQIWALYDKEKELGDTSIWETSLIGHIDRNKDGSWSCFYGCRFIGNEPNRKYAMKLVMLENKVNLDRS